MDKLPENNIDEKNTTEIEDYISPDFEALLKENDLETIAEALQAGYFREVDIMQKDFLERFLDFVHFKIQTGKYHIIHMAYPSKRMIDEEMETKISDLINNHLYPEIVLKLLKYFTRNTKDADTNLYLANLIEEENIIRSIYETFLLFKKDIFQKDPNKRTINVKKILQVPIQTDNRFASPLDAAARLKYVLEYIAIKKNIAHIYTLTDLRMSD